jgi:hypothetical protein
MGAREDWLEAEAAMTARQRKHWDEAELMEMQPDYEAPETGRVVIGGISAAEIIDYGNCVHWGQKGPAWPYEQCPRKAGARTDHEGVGLCWEHGGHTGKGKVQGAILMAHAYADELDVTPWEALLSQVRLLAAQVEWLKDKVQKAEFLRQEDALRPSDPDFHWVVMLEARGDRLAKVSKMAIDAGVAERLVRQVELEAAHMFTAALAGLEAAGITGDQRDKMLETMAGKLLELEAGETV